jgi:hypothetical protein
MVFPKYNAFPGGGLGAYFDKDNDGADPLNDLPPNDASSIFVKLGTTLD